MGKAIRKALLAVGLLALMAGLLRHSGPVGEAVRQGVALCGRSVIPSLFPFFVTVSFAVACGFFSLLRQLRLPLNAAVFLLGAVGGYPVRQHRGPALHPGHRGGGGVRLPGGGVGAVRHPSSGGAGGRRTAGRIR